MDDRQIRRELRLLKGYALASTTLLCVLTLGAFKRQAHEKFTEIDVERINVLEPNGQYRMVISNRPRSIGPIYKGQPFGYAGGGRPGIIFFNDQGTENGGLTFTGSDSGGVVRASTHMSFDQFNSDQVLNLDYSEGGGRRLVGISMLDRAPVNIFDWVKRRDSINAAIPAGPARNAALETLAAPVNGEPFQAQRVFLGRDAMKSAGLVLSDRNGKPRIRLAVDSTGAASLMFLDDSGRVVTRIPETRK